MSCIAILNKMEWKPQVPNRNALTKAILNGTRPSVKDLSSVPDALDQLLKLMLEGQPLVRPTMREVADDLEKPEFWLRGTDAGRFNAYVKWLQEKQVCAPRPPLGLVKCLERAKLAKILVEKMRGDETTTEELAHGLALFSSEDDREVAELRDFVLAQLTERGSLPSAPSRRKRSRTSSSNPVMGSTNRLMKK
jgi:hypothetical protein